MNGDRRHHQGLVALVALVVSCRTSTSWDAVPACENGPFARQVTAVFPPFSPVTTARFSPPEKLKRSIEPGCMIPFRDDTATMDETGRDVGRVVVTTRPRAGGSPTTHGRNGRLWIGRKTLHLQVTDDGGGELLHLEVRDRRVLYRRKGAATFRATIALDDTSPLPLPLDAMVEAIAGCAQDVRSGMSEDGNVIEAKRGSQRLWRVRYLDGDGGAADTSILCGQTDGRLAWRSTAGAMTWTFSVVSARAEEVLTLAQLQRNETEDVNGTDMGPQFELEQ